MFRYSSITTAHKCLKRYDLEYNKGIRAEGRNENLEFGTAMHLALSTYMENRDTNEAKDAFEMYWKTTSDLTFTRFTHEQLSDKFQTMFEKWVRLHSKKYEPKYVEKHLEFSVTGYKFQGTPDFVGEYEGVPSIVDFKTSASVYDKRKIIVNEQMPLYAHAVKQVLDYDVKQLVYVVFVKYDDRIQVVKKDITQKEIDSVVDNMAAMCRDLSSRIEYPKNPDSCLFCPHFSRCHEGEQND